METTDYSSLRVSGVNVQKLKTEDGGKMGGGKID